MRYLPQTENDVRDMLARIGIENVSDLFEHIPEALRLEKPLALPEALSESELTVVLNRMQKRNPQPDDYVQFLGAGAYRHFTPALINHLLLRGEFMTSYTPYQPEVSQGTLQAIFEFQSMISRLTGMEIANASMYDGASALAEAVLMAGRVTGRKEFLVSRAAHSEYRQVVETYTRGAELNIKEIPIAKNGATDLDFVADNLNENVGAVVLQSPNFFGVVEQYPDLGERLEKNGTLLIVAVAEPLSLGILKPPGEHGADIVVGEGQGFGIPVSFGGPYVGFFATREKFFRQVPGRLVGETVDQNNQKAYTLTLSTREQHIRRERATSNICTNQGLCALAATIYMATLGKQGLRDVAAMNAQKAHYLKNELEKLPGYNVRFEAEIFNEFVLDCPEPAETILEKLYPEKILAGVALGRWYPEMQNSLLLCATETNTREEMDRLVHTLAAL